MKGSKVRIGAGLLGLFGVLFILYGLAYGWVAVYAYAIEPGHEAAFYEAYAQISSPIIGVLASGPACYLAARFIRRHVGDRDAWATTIAAGAVLILMDVITVIAFATPAQAVMCLLAIPLKIAGGWLALRGGRAPESLVAA